MKRHWYEISASSEPFEAVLKGEALPCPPKLCCPPTKPHCPQPRTPPEAFIPLEPEASPHDMPSSPTNPTEPNTPRSSSEEAWDPITTNHLARALSVDPAFVPCETFAYSVVCKRKRGQPIVKSQVEELWHLIPKSQLCRDTHSSGGRYVVFGANPRKHDHVTAPTLNLPHSFRLLCSFVRQSHPSFSFSTLSLRYNMFTKPHRDTRNAPGLSYVHSIIPTQGGDLWLADPDGAHVMVCGDVPVYGRVLDIQTQPQLFDARSRLHATVKWEGPARLILVAFTTLHAASSPEVLSQLAEFEVFVKSTATTPHQPTITEAFSRQHLTTTIHLATSDDDGTDPEADE